MWSGEPSVPLGYFGALLWFEDTTGRSAELVGEGVDMLILVVLLPIAFGATAGLVFALRSHDADVAFDRTVDDQLDELPGLIARARESVSVTTDFEPRFFGTPEVQAAFEKALENGAQVRILTDGRVPEWFERQDAIQIGRVEHIETHVTVIDRWHVRLEKPHDHCGFGQRKGDVGMVFQGFPRLARKHAKDFEVAWTSRQ